MILANRAVSSIIALNIVFFLAAIALPPEWLYAISSGTAFGIWVVVVVSYLPEGWRALRRGTLNGWEIAIGGLVTTGIFILLGRVWGQFWRVLEQPDWMTNSWMVSFLQFGLAIGGMMIVIAPGTTLGVVPRGNWWWLAGAAGLGLLLAGFAIGQAVRL